MSNDWKFNKYEPGTITAHAQKFGGQIEKYGLNLNAGSGSNILGWSDLVQAFADCAQDAVDAHIRQQRAKELHIEEGGVEVPETSSYYWARRLRAQINAGPRTIGAIADEFRAAMEAAVDEYIRDHAGHADEGITSDAASESPQEAQGPADRISAQSIIVRFMNGAEEVIHCHHPLVQNGGWTFRELNGIPYLVIGHGVPRRQYPLANIKHIELSPDVL